MQVLLDTNVLLDSLLQRAPWHVDSDAILKAAAADALPGADFEDNIQISAAVLAGLDSIVTRDPAGSAASPIPVLSPTDLLALLASKSPATAPSAAESDGGSQDA